MRRPAILSRRASPHRAEAGEGEWAQPWALQHTRGIVVIGSAATLAVGILAVLAGRYGWLATTQHTTTIAAGGATTVTRTLDPSATRDALLRLATGCGAVTAGLLAWGRIELSVQEHRLARAADERAVGAQKLATAAQLTTERGQITERYTRAVEQLGHDNLAVRLGALYALEAVARDSLPDAQMIYDVIVAFARHHMATHDSEEPLPTQPADYIAALTIALRSASGITLDLSGTIITEMLVHDRHWSSLDLSRCELTNVHFAGCNLRQPRFFGTSLAECGFTNCSLDGGYFSSPDTRLVNVHFVHCQLADVVLNRALLHGCAFSDTTMRGGNISTARFVDSRFETATLVRVAFGIATLEDVTFASCEVETVSLAGIKGHDIEFVGGALTDVQFPRSSVVDIDVMGSRLVRCKFNTLERVSFDPDTYLDGVLIAGDRVPADATKRDDGLWYSGASVSTGTTND